MSETHERAADTRLSPEVRAEKIAELRQLLRDRNQMKWRIGDLVLEITGPPRENQSALRELAVEIAQTERFCALVRSVSFRFPPSTRTHSNVPWWVYKDVINYGEHAERILSEFADAIRILCVNAT